MGAQIALNIPYAHKSFWMRPMELLSDVGHVESRFGLLADNVGIGTR